MSNAVNARLQGDDYQACFFWLQACRMFLPNSGIELVAYEANDIKAFDDVVVYYKQDRPCTDCRNNNIFIDYYQIKYHVDNSQEITLDALKDPGFINATAFSILQRLHKASTKSLQIGQKSRFHLVTPWGVNTKDILSVLISNREGEFRLDKLFDGKQRSKMAIAKNSIKEHLGIKEDQELSDIIEAFRIWHNAWNVQQLINLICIHLTCAGFKPIDNFSLINPYSELIKQWSRNGKKEFSRDFIIRECIKEGLYIGQSRSINRSTVGIRSFLRRAENMEEETQSHLCLLDYYNSRYLKDGFSWNQDIFPLIDKYLAANLSSSSSYELLLDTHLSIAFATGYLLDSKAGIDIYPVQKTRNGRKFWEPIEDSTIVYDALIEENRIINQNGHSIALALSITHDIRNEVIDYVNGKKLDVKRIMCCSVGNSQNNMRIKDGTHAIMIANQVSNLLKSREKDEIGVDLHIFAAAPVSFMFFLGQVSRSFGKCTLYEYDFDYNDNMDKYIPTFSFPITN